MHHFFRHLHDFHGGRHGRRHHHGFFGVGHDFGHGFGPGHMGPGRKLGSADLQLLLLALLAEKASYGYELIKALDERSHGYYSPSPGMIYPALTYLEEIGHATVQAEGTKKLYSITEAGLTHLEQNRAAVDALLEQLTWIGRKMDHLKRAWSGAGEEQEDFDAPHTRGEHWRGFSSEVRMAKRKLKSALIEKAGASAEEQQRIASILERAANEIRGS
jgi:DNA-binding PadR family transcriptional regulator